jgi:hypothetical protein
LSNRPCGQNGTRTRLHSSCKVGAPSTGYLKIDQSETSGRTTPRRDETATNVMSADEARAHMLFGNKRQLADRMLGRLTSRATSTSLATSDILGLASGFESRERYRFSLHRPELWYLLIFRMKAWFDVAGNPGCDRSERCAKNQDCTLGHCTSGHCR